MKATYEELKKENERLREVIKKLNQPNEGFTIKEVLDEMDKQKRNSISLNYVIETPMLKGIQDFWFHKDKLMKVKNKNTLMKDLIAADKNEITPDGYAEWGNDNHYMNFY
jgi:hypothetical protein